MKNNIFSKISGILAVMILLGVAAPQVKAGPTPVTYLPIRTEKAAEVLKPGQSIAITCGGCGAVTIMKVNKDRSNLSTFVCPTCHKEFRVSSSGASGKMHVNGKYMLVAQDGTQAHLAAYSALQ